jgi:cytochrome P450
MAIHDSVSPCPAYGVAESYVPFSRENLSDPYPFMAEARKNSPVFYSPDIDYWIISRYEDVKEILRDHTRFSAEITTHAMTRLYDSSARVLADAGVEFARNIGNEDPPKHTEQRQLISSSFSKGQARRLESKVRKLVGSRVDVFVRDGHADLVKQLFWEVPALVIFAMFGVPNTEIEVVKRFGTDWVDMLYADMDEPTQLKVMSGLADYWCYSKKLLAEHRETPGDGFIDRLVKLGEQRPDLFSDAQILQILMGFLLAGHETTTNTSANGLRTLLENRDQWDLLRADRTLIPNSVEEIIRHGTSTFMWRRITRMPVTVAGVDLPERAKLMLVLGSANHDETVFPEGERMDVCRANARKHLSFGNGVHLCLGAPLARMQIRIFLEELTRRLPHMRLVPGQEWTYRRNIGIRGPQHVLVEWDPAVNPLVVDRP